MSMWMTVVLVVQILTALTMAGLILVQHGKGADMGASLGAGSSGSLFGASGSANFLSRMTALSATVFFAATLALAYMAGSGMQRANSPGSGSSVLDGVTLPVPAETGPASEIPGAGAALAPVSNEPVATGNASVDAIPSASAPVQANGSAAPAAAEGGVAAQSGDAPSGATESVSTEQAPDAESSGSTGAAN